MKRSKTFGFGMLAMAVVAATVCSAVSSTELVMIAKGDRIVLAADGFQYNLILHTAGQACKIGQVGDLFWAAWGIVIDGRTGFNIENFVRAAHRKGGDTGAMLDAIGHKIAGPLQAESQIIKTQNRPFYDLAVKSGMFGGIWAARITGGRVEGYWIDFPIANEKVNPKPAKALLPGQGFSNVPFVNRYAAAQHNTPAFDNDSVIVDYINGLMDFGHTHSPDAIGPPYSILLLTPQGPRWLQRGDCQASKTNHTVQSKKKSPDPHLRTGGI